MLELGGQPAAADDLIKDSSEATFMQDVVEVSKTTPVIVDFWAPWCGPCKMMGPEFEKAAKALAGKARLVKVNTQAHQSVSGKMRIKGIPTMIAWQNGREVKRQAGAMKMGQIVGWVPTS